MREKRLHPRRVGRELRLGLMPRGHRQQIADAHLLEFIRRLFGRVVREELQHKIVNAQLPVRDGQSHRRRAKTLAERMQDMRLLG